MATVSVLLLLLSAFSPPVFTAFHVIKGNMNQSKAQAACRGNHADLVTVYSEEDNTDLVNKTMEAGINDGWIGLYRSQSREMKWSNGDPVTFNLTQDSSNQWTYCAVMKADGAWDPLTCTVTRYFMCYEQNASSQTPIYHLICECKTWFEAQSYCRRCYTDLVSIRDQQQNEEVKINGSKSPTPFWIGLLCDDWQWTDGGNSTYRKWGSAEPQSSLKDCVVLSGGNWSTVPCSEKHSALCYGNATSVNAASSSAKTTSCVNPMSCSTQTTSCVNPTSSSAQTQPCTEGVHVSDYPMPWEDVLDYGTKGKMTGVLIISSADEQKVVESELRRRNISEPVWVGLRQSILLGFWIWVDGTAVYQYSNWNKGKQPEGPLTQHCGAVVPPNYTWSDMNCRAHYKALFCTKCP